MIKEKIITNKRPIQILDKSSYTKQKTWGGITLTSYDDGTYTLNGTATVDSYIALVDKYFKVNTSHKYLVRGCPTGGGVNTYYQYLNNTDGTPVAADYGSGAIGSPKTNLAKFNISVHHGQAVNNLRFRPEVFDLTAMYGVGKEPTIAQFNATYPVSTYGSPMFRSSDLHSKQTENGVTFTPDTAAGTITVSGTATAATYGKVLKSGASFSYTIGHVYCMMPDVNANHSCFEYVSFYSSAGWLAQIDALDNPIYKCGDNVSRTSPVYIKVNKDYTANNIVLTPIIYDLTVLYGAGKEPATLQDFISTFPVYKYNLPAETCYKKVIKLTDTKSVTYYNEKIILDNGKTI